MRFVLAILLATIDPARAGEFSAGIRATIGQVMADAAAPQPDQLADAVARRVAQRLAAQLASLACPLPASPVRSPPPTSAPGRPRASRPLVWSDDLAAAQRAAAAAGKPVLAYFTMNGCRACEQLEQLHRDPAVAAAILERYVPVRLRYEDSPAEFRRFRVSVAPTLVVLRGSSTLARKSGATDQRAYLEWLRRPHAAP